MISGLLIGQITPPLLSPDEHAHLVRAYTLVSGEWEMHAPKGRSTAAWIDPALAKFIQVHRERNRVALGRSPGPPPTAAALTEAGNARLSGSGQPIALSAPGAAVYPPIAYLPQGLALGCARRLHLTAGSTYRLARLVSLITSTAILFAAFLLFTPSPLQLALLSLPMSLFQLSSAALDGFSNSVAVLLLSFYQAIPEAHPNKRPILHISLLLSILVVVPARLHLWPLLILPFLAGRKLESPWAGFINLASLSAVVIWVARVSRSTVDLRRTHLGTDAVHTAIQFLAHPGELISLLIRTLTNQELVSFYGRSFIGVSVGFIYRLTPPGLSNTDAHTLVCAGLTLMWTRGQTVRILFQKAVAVGCSRHA